MKSQSEDRRVIISHPFFRTPQNSRGGFKKGWGTLVLSSGMEKAESLGHAATNLKTSICTFAGLIRKQDCRQCWLAAYGAFCIMRTSIDSVTAIPTVSPVSSLMRREGPSKKILFGFSKTSSLLNGISV